MENSILDEDNNLQLNIEVIRSEVEDYTQRAHHMSKANKEVRSWERSETDSKGLYMAYLSQCGEVLTCSHAGAPASD